MRDISITKLRARLEVGWEEDVVDEVKVTVDWFWMNSVMLLLFLCISNDLKCLLGTGLGGSPTLNPNLVQVINIVNTNWVSVSGHHINHNHLGHGNDQHSVQFGLCDIDVGGRDLDGLTPVTNSIMLTTDVLLNMRVIKTS